MAIEPFKCTEGILFCSQPRMEGMERDSTLKKLAGLFFKFGDVVLLKSPKVKYE